jgi:hypothetical protein
VVSCTDDVEPGRREEALVDPARREEELPMNCAAIVVNIPVTMIGRWRI